MHGISFQFFSVGMGLASSMASSTTIMLTEPLDRGKLKRIVALVHKSCSSCISVCLGNDVSVHLGYELPVLLGD